MGNERSEQKMQGYQRPFLGRGRIGNMGGRPGGKSKAGERDRGRIVKWLEA